jgi:diadenosine tetraphosphatase ApaH/serine/threonine PP2A family protein phosphatase
MMMPRPHAGELDKTRHERWEFLKSLPYRHVQGDALFVHAAPRNPVIEYLRKMDVLLGMTDKVAENLKQVDWLCFIGHTHQPGVITRDMKFLEVADFNGAYRPEPHHKAIINVGSVGQPRDGDWRACFVTIEDDGVVRYHRVAYDVDAAARKLVEVAAVDETLADRLRKGR